MDLAGVNVLAFDVFGTVVDWHSSVAAERPLEFGPNGKDVSPDPATTLHVRDLRDLAERLGC